MDQLSSVRVWSWQHAFKQLLSYVANSYQPLCIHRAVASGEPSVGGAEWE